YPFAYTPHYARHVDPATGAESKIIVVPADQSLSWQDGYAPLGLGDLNTLQAQNQASRPQLLLFAHDGDNNWGGGFSYYMEAVPNFVNSASNAGYVATTIEQYLTDHPVPANDVVHVEDGAWVNADGDFGSPVFANWNWPLVNNSGQIDIANGWAEDERNWAVITAAQNRVDTAEQIACGGSPGCLNTAKILYPDASTTGAERAWHYFLGALNSGYMYYGTALDMEVKPTIACNEAMQHADPIIGVGTLDMTPPTIWIPQRHPWNPGSLNFGPQFGYQQVTNNGDFWIWTFAYDVSGISTVTLKYRIDDDTIVTDANRIYAGGAGVGAWQDLAMTQRIFPTGNFFNDPSIDFYVLPTYMSDEYYVQLTGIRSKLVDYYVEAVDTKGYIRKSPIQHVYVGSGVGGGPGNPRVTFTPSPAVAGQPLLISYDAVGGPLAGAATINAHVGFNNWGTVPPDVAMTFNAGSSRWEAMVTVAMTASQVDAAFNNGAGTWDNNNGQDWHVAATGGIVPWTLDGQLDADAILASENGTMQLHAGVKGGVLYVAAPSARNGNDHFLFVADTPGAMRAAPWAKAGQVADWSAFLANESTNNFKGWFDTGAGVAVQSASSVGGWLEGTIDLAAELGSLPDTIYLSLIPYATPDGGAVASSLQVPAGNGNGTIEAAEYVAFETFRRGDLTGDWRIDPADVNDFVNVLLGMDIQSTHIRAADMNADGFATGIDIQPFINAILAL
ncbi:MAG: dockerin type I domain-containing protein, partial [Planctomycetota bacterium]